MIRGGEPFTLVPQVTAWRRAAAVASALGTMLASLLRLRRSGSRARLAPGDVAPAFTLAASDGRTYRLADFIGRVVVIAWVPKAFTSVCTAECRSIGLTSAALAGYDAAVFAASCDTATVNREFAAATGIQVPILSDPDTQVARAYGVLGPLGLPRRETIYIGADGRLLAVDRDVRSANHGADIASALQRFGVPRRP